MTEIVHVTVLRETVAINIEHFTKHTNKTQGLKKFKIC